MKKKFCISVLVILNVLNITILKIKAQEQEIVILNNEIKIISRKEWGAKDPIKVMENNKLDKITIHHAGIIYPPKVNLIEKMRSLQKYSQSSEKMANGKIKEIWSDIPYHFVISGTGEIAEGRNINYSGDTNTEYDPKNHILIDVLGNFETQEITKDQLNALIKLCSYLSKKYNISTDKIQGHNYYTKTDCPGKNLSKLIPKIKELVSKN